MTKERKLLRRVLDALNQNEFEPHSALQEEILAHLAAEEGKREEEPVAWWYSPTSKTVSGVETSHHTIQLCIPSTQAEPVYLFRRKGLDDFVTCSKERFDELSENALFETKVLHPAPQRSFVRLSEEEICIVMDNVLEGGGWSDVARAIEDALEEKNK